MCAANGQSHEEIMSKEEIINLIPKSHDLLDSWERENLLKLISSVDRVYPTLCEELLLTDNSRRAGFIIAILGKTKNNKSEVLKCIREYMTRHKNDNPQPDSIFSGLLVLGDIGDSEDIEILSHFLNVGFDSSRVNAAQAIEQIQKREEARVKAINPSDPTTLVRAIVRELKHDPNSAPLEWQNIPGKPSPIWTVELEIEQVFRGDSALKGKMMITTTANSPVAGNWNHLTPRLNIGDRGIWAIKQYDDGSLGEVYSPYVIEKGLALPLIEGRDDSYGKVLKRLTEATATTQVSVDQPTASNNTQESSPTEEPMNEPTSSNMWIILVLVIPAVFGLLWFVLKRRS